MKRLTNGSSYVIRQSSHHVACVRGSACPPQLTVYLVDLLLQSGEVGLSGVSENSVGSVSTSGPSAPPLHHCLSQMPPREPNSVQDHHM